MLCDRGTVDGLAYWPGPESFWDHVATTLEQQLARYDAVIHLRTPSAANGYNQSNPLRTEGAAEAEPREAVAVPISTGTPVAAGENRATKEAEDLDIPAFLRRSR